MQMVDEEVRNSFELKEIHDHHTCLMSQNLSIPHVKTIICVGGGNDQSWANGRAWIDDFRIKIENGIETGIKRKLTVINVDAHLDVRPLIGDEKQPHSGSPFRQIIQYINNDEELQLLEFAAQGESCSSNHVEFVEMNGGKIFWLSELRKIDHNNNNNINCKFQSSVAKKLKQILDECKIENRRVFFSFDIDAIRGADAPGVSCPAIRGLTSEEALEMCMVAGMCESVNLFDISEFNPKIESDRTCRLVCQMIYHFILGFVQRTQNL